MGVTKGLATQRMVQLMADVYGLDRVQFDFVLAIGGCGWRHHSHHIIGYHILCILCT